MSTHTTDAQKEKLRELIFSKPQPSGKEIALEAGVSEAVVTYFKGKWGMKRKVRKSGPRNKLVRVIKGTEFMGTNKKAKKPEITDEMTVLFGLQKTYNGLSIVDKAVFLSDLKKFVDKETGNINSLTL